MKPFRNLRGMVSRACACARKRPVAVEYFYTYVGYRGASCTRDLRSHTHITRAACEELLTGSGCPCPGAPQSGRRRRRPWARAGRRRCSRLGSAPPVSRKRTRCCNNTVGASNHLYQSNGRDYYHHHHHNNNNYNY